MYFDTPSETGIAGAGGVVELVAGAWAGAGFCAGSCAKTGEIGPPASRPANPAAVSVLAKRASQLAAANVLDRFRVADVWVDAIDRSAVNRSKLMIVFTP